MAEKEKVFCKNCRYHEYGDCIYNPSIRYDPIDGEIHDYKQCDQKNKTMHCKDFVKKPFLRWQN